MPTAPLPENPSLEHLKGQAKLVRDLVRSGDDGALAMVDEFHPRLSAADLDEDARSIFKTADAQLIVARMYRFVSWPELRRHLGIVDQRSFTPLPEDAELSAVDSFVAAACLDYSERGPRPDVRIATANRMLADDPILASASIAAIATVGDHDALRRALAAEPDAARSPCGPNGWPPLLYATFSRINARSSKASTIETVGVLLDAGADPNAGFLWRGLVPPFTALTGALGGGENYQRPLAERLAVSRLLLEAGADPNDGQGLYNNGIGGMNADDPAHLELLVEYGLGSTSSGPWYQRFGDQLRTPQELLYDEIEGAAKKNRPRVLAYLLGLGLDGARNVGRSKLPPARIAAAQGNDEILATLADHGIDIGLTPVEEALACTRSGDTDGLGALLGRHLDLLAELRDDHPDVCRNISADHGAMLERLMALGFDINDRSTTKTPLHHAAEAGDTERARLLIDHGADANLVDTHIGSTPWGWANHFGHTETAAYLRPLTHEDAPLPEITIVSPTLRCTLASPALIEQRLGDIHAAEKPTLTTLRSGRLALTIGLGHPSASVVLFRDETNTSWHAAGESLVAIDSQGDLSWAWTEGSHTFHAAAHVSLGTARRIASRFIAHPTERPDANWRLEGQTN